MHLNDLKGNNQKDTLIVMIVMIIIIIIGIHSLVVCTHNPTGRNETMRNKTTH